MTRTRTLRRTAGTGLTTIALALCAVLAASVPASSVAPAAPAPAPTPASTPTPGTTPRPAGACQATYRTIASWPGGYVAEVTVFSSNPISAWSVAWSTTGGSVQNVWGGELTNLSGLAVVRSSAWNGDVPAGGTATFGLYGTGAATSPFLTCTA